MINAINPKSRTFKTLVLTASKAITSFSTLALLMFLSRVLSEADYGVLRQVSSIGRVILPLAMLGLPQALIYFLPKNRQSARRYYSIAVLLFTLVTLVLGGLAFCFKGNLADYYGSPLLADLIVYIFAWVWAIGALTISLHALLGLERANSSAVISSIHAVIRVGIVAICAYYWDEVRVVIMSFGLAPLAVSVPLCVYIWKVSPSSNKSIGFVKSVPEVLKYSTPLCVSNFVANCGRQMSLIIVAPMLSAELFGVYANGAMELPLVGMLTGSAVAVITPEIVRQYSAGNKVECVRLWTKTAYKTALVIFPVFIYFMVNAEIFMVSLYSDKYAGSALPFRIFLLLLPMRVIYFGVVYIAASKPKLLLLRSVVTTIISVVVSLLVAKYWNPMYAAIGFVTAIYLWALPFNIFWWRKIMGVRLVEALDFNLLGKIFTLALICSIAIYAVNWCEFIPAVSLIVSGLIYFPLVFLICRKNQNKLNLR
ncbi:lipopolysaccharide biosynthesis protein [Rubritalea profundi]|uniref:Polysaccharide biosynthesis protein C-terminal domain-containing protein n=1 Tax=Rubritalea profundi TaxID=1658618 RepID=A0A2S7U1K8_9BACT|nr:oligosaccharide flippase family protein [Rubritalea profundi]PQJ28063.1 hypothetical protein BSZ32_05805 [Rubritalea profundi]